MSIAKSMRPILIFLEICSIPTYNKMGKSSYRLSSNYRVFIYFLRSLPSLICLLLNCSFQVYNMVGNMKIYFDCDSLSFSMAWKLLPMAVSALFQFVMKLIFMTGIPLVFAIQFYLTGRFQQMLSSLQKLDEKLSLPASYHRKCSRKTCIYLIIISLTVLTII